MAQSQLIGRDHEVAVLHAVLDDARAGRSRTVVLHGEAGIGKTALLEATVAAASADFQVIRAQGVAAESTVPMSGFFDLTRGLLGHLGQLPAPQRDAVRGALGQDTAPPPSDRFTLGVALLGLLSAAAELRPVLVAVDDLGLVDTASRSALVFAARRLGAERVAVVATVRTGEGESQLPRFEVVEVGPLAHDDARRLLHLHMHRPLDDPATSRLLDAAMGNPLALVELPRVWRGTAWAPDEPVPLSDRLEESFARRLETLSAGARLALVVAAAASRPELDVVRAALDSLRLGEDALDEGEDAGLVEQADGRVRFRHPLMRAAAYRSASPAQQRAAHTALAGAWAAAGMLDQRARHLAAAATGPDEDIAAQLENAARINARRGAHAAASADLERAAELSTSDEAAADRRLAAGEAAVLAGDAARATALADAARLGTDDVVLRGRIELFRGRIGVLVSASDAVVDDLQAAADAVQDLDGELAVRLRIEVVLLGFHTRSRGPALVETCRSLVADAEAADAGPDVRRRATIALATVLASQGELVAARAHIDTLHAIELDSTAVDLLELFCYAALARGQAEDPRGAIATVAPLVEAARAEGTVGALAFPLAIVSNASFLSGDFHRARSAGAEAADLSEATGQLTMQVFAAMCNALVTAGRGEEAACRELVAGGLALAKVAGAQALPTTMLWALGQLELSLGRAAAAVGSLRDCADLIAALGVDSPPGVVRHDADLVEALAQLDRPDEAAAVLGRFAERVVASGSRYGLAAVARCRGILGDAGRVDAHFAEAVVLNADDPNPFELARTQLAWGRRLVGLGRYEDARAHLHAAMAAFVDLEAAGWVQRAGELLAQAGDPTALPPPAVSSLLTARELRIAAATARGLTPAEIAAELFITPATVRRALTEVERTLEVSSPQELAQRLGSAIKETLPPAPATRIAVLGHFAVHVEGDAVAGLTGIPGRALRAVAAHGGRLSTDELVEILWPSQPEGRGRTRLRQVLWRIADLAGPLLERHGETVRVRAGVEVDAVVFEREADAATTAAARGDGDAAMAAARRAVDAYAGDLLPDERADGWVLSRRERLRRRLLATLDLLADLHAARGEPDAAVGLLERAIELEPLDEDRYVRAARVLLGAGRNTAARSFADRAAAVARELDLPVPPVIAALAAEIARPVPRN